MVSTGIIKKRHFPDTLTEAGKSVSQIGDPKGANADSPANDSLRKQSREESTL